MANNNTTMNVLFKNVTIIDTSSSFHQKKIDVKITSGIIETIQETIPETATHQTISIPNLHISQGWFDSSVSLGEPGYEDRETLQNGLDVAAKSGFTGIALQPNTQPVLDNQSQINFIKNKAAQHTVSVYPVGAFTQNSEGNVLAELFDMKNAGAVAFTDYNKSFANTNLLKIGLQYLQDFNGLLIAFCQDKNLAGKGVVNEGATAMHLGLKGIPSLAEEVAVAKALQILEYSGGKLHIPTVSSSKSVAMIAEAKAKGLHVTCSVAVHHLLLSDEKLNTFDTRYKVLPPLRQESERQALIEAVKNNTIDCITSDHNPMDIENKFLEFDLASNGTIGLESAFGALCTLFPIETVIEKLTIGRTIFGLTQPKIAEGNVADISLFIPNSEWTFEPENILSKSKNSAFIGEKMKGKPIGIYSNTNLIINND
jgi:dihydroorotase